MPTWTPSDEGIGSWPERHLRVTPRAPAVWFEGSTTTHGEFALRVRRAAGALADLGVRAGDRVGVLSANHPAMLESLFAAAQLGAIWVPVNGRLTPPEIAFVLEDAGTEVVLHGREHGTTVDRLRPLLPAVRAWVAIEPPVSGSAGSPDWETLLSAAEATPRDTPVTADDPCLVMYTSGTTGKPKGAVLTHGNLTWAGLSNALDFGLSAADRALAMAPLFHIGGLQGMLLPTLLRGGSAVVVRGFDAAAVLEVIEQQRVTAFFAVATMLDAMARDPGFAARDLSSVRSIGAAGAPLPVPLLRTWLDRGVLVQQAYGMTESAASGTILESSAATSRIGSAGRPQSFLDVRVVRPDGTETAPGEIGEVVLRGRTIMAGYWGRPDATAEVLRDGWYHSGDAGSLDEDGYLTIRDRYKDMIISGGENVYPAEVESALLELPGVQEAAVIGVPDDRWGEVGLALVVPTPGSVLDEASLTAALRERLAGFKVPKQFRFTDGLPKTASGKIRKPALRQQYALTEESTP